MSQQIATIILKNDCGDVVVNTVLHGDRLDLDFLRGDEVLGAAIRSGCEIDNITSVELKVEPA